MKPGDLVLVRWNSSPPEIGLLVQIFDGIQRDDSLRAKVLVREKIRIVPSRILEVINENR
jgi:hypothetical protein